MKLFLTSLILLFSASFAFNQTIWSRAKTTPENGSKYGIILADGSWLIEPNYDNIRILTKRHFQPQFYFMVEMNGKYGLLDSMGKTVLPTAFDIIQPSNQFIWVDVDGKAGAYSFSGRKMLDAQYEQVITAMYDLYVRLSPQGEFIGFGKEGYFGVVDTSGNIIVPPNFDFIQQRGGFYEVRKNGVLGLYNRFGQKINIDGFSEFEGDHNSRPLGYLKAKANNHWCVIDSVGNRIIEPIYTLVRFGKGYISLETDDNQLGIASLSGEMILEPIYDLIIPDEQHRYFRYRRNNKWGMCFVDGKQILPLAYDEIHYTNYYFELTKDGKQGVCNNDGQLVLEAECDKIYFGKKYNYRSNTLIYKKNGKFGAVDLSTKEIAPAIYDTIGYMDQLISAELDGKFSVFNYDGDQLFARADEIRPFRNLLFYRKNNLWAALSKHGEEVIPPTYSEIGHQYYSSLIVAKKGTKWGYISDKGEVAIPFVYDSAEEFQYTSAKVSKNGEHFEIDKNDKRIRIKQEIDPFSSNGGYGSGTGYEPFGNGSMRDVAPPAPPIPNFHPNIQRLEAFWADDKVGAYYKGEVLLPAEYSQIRVSEQAIILVQKGELWGGIDFNGNPVLPMHFAELSDFRQIDPDSDDYDQPLCAVYTSELPITKSMKKSIGLYTPWEFYEPLFDQKNTTHGFYEASFGHFGFDRGLPSMNEFIQSEMRYPKKGRKLTTITTVYVKCIIEKDGKISSIQMDDPTIPEYFKNEAKRIILAMPALKATRRIRSNLPYRMIIPIIFDPTDYKQKKSK